MQLLKKKMSNSNHFTDLTIFIMAGITLATESDATSVIGIIAIISRIITSCSHLSQKEIYLIHSQSASKYWDIVKIIAFNLIAAHTLSIILNMVGSYSLKHC
jgi:hypothetical protein